MSQHADLIKHSVSKSIKVGNSWAMTLECANDLLDTAEYDEDFYLDDKKLTAQCEYMLTQSDGLYGVSHFKIKEFLRNKGGTPPADCKYDVIGQGLLMNKMLYIIVSRPFYQGSQGDIVGYADTFEAAEQWIKGNASVKKEGDLYNCFEERQWWKIVAAKNLTEPNPFIKRGGEFGVY